MESGFPALMVGGFYLPALEHQVCFRAYQLQDPFVVMVGDGSWVKTSLDSCRLPGGEASLSLKRGWGGGPR